jgi:hypothetical protein
MSDEEPSGGGPVCCPMAVAMCGLGSVIVDRGGRGEAGETDSCSQRAEEDGAAKAEHGVGSVVLRSKAAGPQSGMCIGGIEKASLEGADAGHGELARRMAGVGPIEIVRGEVSCTMEKSVVEPDIPRMDVPVAHCERRL